MSTPVLYIAVPVVLALLLFFLRKKPNVSLIISMVLYFTLILLAFFQDFGEVFSIGPISFELRSSLNILGREFTLSNSDRFFLIVICLTSLLWLGGLRQAGLNAQIIPYQMLIASSLTTALAVEPFVYSAIFVEIAVICSIPILIHSGKPISKGALRFLIFQSLAMPLILLGGWLVAGSQASPSDVRQISIAGFLLGTGFAFWIAVFPFHTWIPQLSEDTHPYISGYLLTLFPQVALLVIVDFTSSITWIRESSLFGTIFLVIGFIMLIASAIWCLYEKKIERIFAYLVLLGTSSLLIMIGLQTSLTLQAFYLSLIPRLISLLLIVLCLSIIQSEENFVSDISGSFRKFPFASAGLLFGISSIIGLPPLGEFPFRLIQFNSLGSSSIVKPIWVIIGFIGFLFPLFRLIVKIFQSNVPLFQIRETWKQILLVSIGILLLLLIGIFPGGLQLIFSNLFQYLPFLE